MRLLMARNAISIYQNTNGLPDTNPR